MGTHSGRCVSRAFGKFVCGVVTIFGGSRFTPCAGNVEPNAEFQLTSEGVRERPQLQKEGRRISSSSSSSSLEKNISCAPLNSSAPYLWLAHPTEGSSRSPRAATRTPLAHTFVSSPGTSPGNLRTYAGDV